MSVEQQYIDLFSQTEAMICRHSAEVLNAPRAAAFADFERLGFPTRKTEKYKYTDVSKFFEPDYGLNLNRLEIPVNPYEVFKCDVPNMSTSLYFVVNDAFYNKALPKSHLPEGVIFGSLKEMAEQRPELVKKYYGKLADTSKDGVTAFNTAFAQDGVLLYVPKNVVVEKPPVGEHSARRCQLYGEPPCAYHFGRGCASPSSGMRPRHGQCEFPCYASGRGIRRGERHFRLL